MHRHHGRQLPHGEPQRLHRVGHHLPVADGDVDPVLPVGALRDREQRRDRPALHDPEAVVHQAPFDVLGVAEVRFDPPPELDQPYGLRIGQRRLLLPLCVDRHLLRTPGRQGGQGPMFGGDRPGYDLAVTHGEDVRVDQAGDQCLAEAESGVHGGGPPVAREGVGREQDAGRVREDHLLHDHGHVHRAVVDAAAPAVGHGALGEERGPAPADVAEDRRRAHDVEVRVLLAGEGGRRQVLRRRAGAHGVGGPFTGPGERAGDRRREIVRGGGFLDGPADLRAERTDRFPVVRLRTRQPVEQSVDRGRLLDDPPEGLRRHAETSRHADPFDARERAEVCALAADERDLGLVHLVKVPHVLLVHCAASKAVMAQVDDSAPCPGPCGKPPVAL